MTQYHVAYIDGRYQVYTTRTGIDRTNVGPRWMTPGEANAYADKLAAIPATSPLRSSAGESAVPDSPADARSVASAWG